LERSNRLWDALDQTDAVPTTTWTAPADPEPVPARAWFGGARRGIATALLAVGLLVVGGVAAVNAADPSASPAPNATQPSDGGSSGQPANPNSGSGEGHQRGDCPADGSGSGNGSSGGSGTTPAPVASPDAEGL
jgi:hypothetical protein